MDFKLGVGIGAGIAVFGAWLFLAAVAAVRIQTKSTSTAQGRDWSFTEVLYLLVGAMAVWGTTYLVGAVT
ncbi:hypothetical protein [Novosphingobium sp.]|uniref:hypothetical protein n=1 Tax=Novosphingobium sp. TaxID=1874826 RepID=UPI0035647121